jgi:hypothetical protein
MPSRDGTPPAKLAGSPRDVMGTLGGFATPFGPPPATASPLASLGLAKPSRDGTPPAKLLKVSENVLLTGQ